MSTTALPYKISTLIYIRNHANELLLLERLKAPNAGLWSPIGGKLDMGSGESPFEAARREAAEEIGLTLRDEDLHLFAMIAEKNYEFKVHWLMFLFDCSQTIADLPPPISEGRFAFVPEADIPTLKIPETDSLSLWPAYRKYRRGFVSLRADCRPDRPLQVITEQVLPPATAE